MYLGKSTVVEPRPLRVYPPKWITNVCFRYNNTRWIYHYRHVAEANSTLLNIRKSKWSLLAVYIYVGLRRITRDFRVYVPPQYRVLFWLIGLFNEKFTIEYLGKVCMSFLPSGSLLSNNETFTFVIHTNDNNIIIYIVTSSRSVLKVLGRHFDD